MIVRADPDGGSWLCIGQASHAWVSGQLARAWAEPFSPREEVCLAAEQHDVGMAQWDRAPDRDPATGLPYDFRALPRATHIALWDAAAERLLSQSAYAALLVSLHGTGLYERFPAPPEHAAAAAALLERQRALQGRLIAALGADRDALARNRALVARWDGLSLELCFGAQPVLDPWPFAAPEIELRCEARRLAAPQPTTEALHAALDAAPLVPLRWVLRRT